MSGIVGRWIEKMEGIGAGTVMGGSGGGNSPLKVVTENIVARMKRGSPSFKQSFERGADVGGGLEEGIVHNESVST